MPNSITLSDHSELQIIMGLSCSQLFSKIIGSLQICVPYLDFQKIVGWYKDIGWFETTCQY